MGGDGSKLLSDSLATMPLALPRLPPPLPFAAPFPMDGGSDFFTAASESCTAVSHGTPSAHKFGAAW